MEKEDKDKMEKEPRYSDSGRLVLSSLSGDQLSRVQFTDVNPVLLIGAERVKAAVEKAVPSLLGDKEAVYSCRVFGRSQGRVQVEVGAPSGGIACCVNRASMARFIAWAFTLAAEALEKRESGQE